MIDIIFMGGLVVFSISSLYFFFNRHKPEGLNTAFLVSFVTIASYVLMWDGFFAVESPAGQPIFWSRWLFYVVSCSLLMLEIGRAKGITSTGKVAELVFLNTIVMVTGTVSAVTSGWTKWLFFAISAIAYLILIIPLLRVRDGDSNWIDKYILLGWSGFPVVFFLAPTGIGLFGSAVAMGLYLLLDIYTKIAFNLQLKA